MKHLLAYALNSSGAVVAADMAAQNDGIVVVQNGHFLFQQDVKLLAAWVMGATIGRARINSPTMRQVSPSYLRPVIAAATPPSNPNTVWFDQNGPTLRGLEEIQIEAWDSAVAGEHITAGLLIEDVPTPKPIGPEYTIRGTGTTTLVANTWTQVPITMESSIPQGLYSVTGAELFSATSKFFRLTFDNQYFRPGWTGLAAETGREFWPLYQERFGEWGKFRTTRYPSLEVYADAADTAETLYLTCVRIGTI